MSTLEGLPSTRSRILPERPPLSSLFLLCFQCLGQLFTTAGTAKLRRRGAQIAVHGPQGQGGGQVQSSVADPQTRRHHDIATGGVRGLEDISACAALAHKGLEGVIIGRALYDGRIDLKQALAAAKG